MPSTRTIVLVSVAVLATAGVGYAIYFDHKRRTDPEFRRQIRRGARQAEKKRKKEEESAREANKKDHQRAWRELKGETYPNRPEEMEQFFLQHIAHGENLYQQGPTKYQESAKHFFRGLKVFPNTAELLGIYEKTVPEGVFEFIMGIREAEAAEMSASTGMD